MQSMRMRPTVTMLPMLCGLRVVCLSDTTFSPTKMAESIQLLCLVETQIGPSNHLLDGYPKNPGKGAISGDKVCGSSDGSDSVTPKSAS